MASDGVGAVRSRPSTAGSTAAGRTRSTFDRRSMPRPDPYRAFRFRVEIDQTQEAGFQMVSGLERETKTDAYREGGVNHFEHQLAGFTTYPPLTLKHGLVD